MSWQWLEITYRHHISRAAELFSANALPWRWLICSLGSNMVRDPLGGCARPGLGGDSSHARQAGLSPVPQAVVLVGDIRAIGAGSSIAVCSEHLVQELTFANEKTGAQVWQQ